MVKKAAVTKEYTHVTHPFPALYNKESEILILGSLPSVKSREQMFFYGHPQNRHILKGMVEKRFREGVR